MTPESPARYAPTPAAPSVLQTMRSGEVLDEALRTYRLLAPVLLRRSAVPAAFVLASVLSWTRLFLPRLFTTTHPGDVTGQVGEATFALAMGMLVAGPLLVFGIAEGTAQAVALVSSYREGRWRGEAAAAREARAAFPRVLLAGLWTFLLAAVVPWLSFGLMAVGGLLSGQEGTLSGVLAAVGIVGMCVGCGVGLWAVVAHALAPAACLQGEGPIAACRRSRKLIAGTGNIPGGGGTVWMMYGIFLVTASALQGGLAALTSFVPFDKMLPGGGLFSQALSVVGPFVITWILLPLWGTTVAIMDAERRVRKEGYDVELLAKG